MKTLAIGSFLVLFAIVSGMTVIMPSAFAAEVGVPSGTGVPGCEETNECWDPAELTIPVGETVTWSNDDTAAHTVTSGSPVDGPDGNFDSSLFLAGTTFAHTFDAAGEFPYFCMVHPWMEGMIIVGGAMAEEEMVEAEVMEEEEVMMEEGMMSGVNVDMKASPMLPFDNMANDMVTLEFTAKSDVLFGEGVIDHLDYKVVITKDGNEVWSEQFHEHDGNLELQITPSEGSFTTSGGEEVGSTETKAFMVTGPVFMDNGDYDVSAQIVGIEFQPLSEPLIDDFTVQVIPEFGQIAMLVLSVGIISIIAITAKTKIIQKL